MKADTIERRHKSVRRVMTYIASNLDEPCTTSQLSRIACFAPFHFHRIFREETGLSLGNYVRRMRLEQAVYQLLFSKRSIIEIALGVGYQSNEAFTRSFEQVFEIAPSRFRTAFENGHDQAPTMPPALTRFFTDMTPIATRTMPPVRVAYCSHFGHYAKVESYWAQLRGRLLACGLRPERMQAIGVVYDDPNLETTSNVRYDTCVVVSRDFVGDGTLSLQVLPGADAVVLRHAGAATMTPRSFLRGSNAWMICVYRPRLRRLPYFELYKYFPFYIKNDDIVDIQLAVPLVRQEVGAK